MTGLGLILVATLLGTAIALVGPSETKAADTQCTGLLTGTYDSIVVPPGQSCELDGALVNGNVTALEGSRLRVVNNVRVGGGIEGDRAEDVLIGNSVVVGNIVIRGGGSGTSHGVGLCFVTVEKGDVLIEEPAGFVFFGFVLPISACGGNFIQKGGVTISGMLGTGLFVGGNSIAGNLEVLGNTASLGMLIDDNLVAKKLQILGNDSAGIRVERNIVGKNLECFENTGPFVCGPNTAKKTEGQCF